MGTRMRRAVVAALIVGAGYMAVGSATAGASSGGPYQAGTMFIADQNYGGESPPWGEVWSVPPGGGPVEGFDGPGESDQDVAVDSAGDVFWTQLNDGTIDERLAGGSDVVLASGFQPTGIAVDGAGDVYFGSFGAGSNPAGLYEIPSGSSTPTLVTSRFSEFQSLAVDGSGDVWGVGSSDNLVVVPPRTAGEGLNIGGAGFDGVRLDGSDDLFASTAFGDSAIEVAPGAVTAATLGTLGNYTEGVAVDGSGNVFVGTPSGVPGYGKVYELPSGGGSSIYADGDLASTNGLAVYPPPSPAARSAGSISLSGSPDGGDVTTQTTVTLTATVPSGETGGVQFDDNGNPMGTAVATSGGTASTSTTLSAGTHDITATYLGDSSTAPAVSNDLSFTSTAIATKTVLSFPNGTSVPGDQPLTVDAEVSGSGGTPTGYVEFYDGTRDEGSGELDSNRTTSFSFSPAPGSSTVHAVYEGDSTFAASHSKSTTITTTTPYPPTLSTRVRYGAPIGTGAVKATIRVTVTGVRIEPAPTGTVSANDNFACAALTPVTGTDKSVASCSAWLRSGASKDVTLTFTSGDGNYDSGTTSQYVYNGGGGG